MRCPRCYRRLPPGSSCRTDGERVPEPPIAEAAPPPFSGFSDWRLIGAGGFARVFAARAHDGREVAIKIALFARDERFENEIAALRNLPVTVVPAFYEAGKTADGHAFIVSELVPGRSLAELLAAHEPAALRPDEMLPLFTRLCDGVQKIHEAGWVHRDLKPENIFVRPDGAVIILDLGLARPLAAAGAPPVGPTLTLTGQRLGTVTYMSPEQCRGEAGADPRSDVYALGVMLFELLAGRPPFVGHAPTVEQEHISRRPPPLPPSDETLAPFAPLVARALAKQPGERFASVAELSAAVQQAASTRAMQPASAVTHATQAPRQGRTLAALALRTSAPMTIVQDAVVAGGGRIVHTSRDTIVAAFAGDAAASSVRAAVAVAEGLASHVELAVVHVCEARVRDRGNGIVILGAALVDPDRWLPARGARGVILTRAAAELLPSATAEASVTGFFVVARDLRSVVLEAPPVVEVLLVGRDEIVGTVADEVRRCNRDLTSAVLTVTGEAGHGKSRVAAAVAERLRSDGGARVIELTARQPDSGDDTTLLMQLTQLVLGLHRARPTADEIRAASISALGAKHGAALWPVAALAMNVLSEEASAVAPMRAAPGAIRQATARALGIGLRRMASREPLVVVLDDAHWADQASLDAIEHATLSEAGAPITVVSFVRPVFEQARPMWGARAGRRGVYKLEPLSAAEAAQLCRRLLLPAENVPAPVIDLLVERTQGVPQLLTDLVAALKREGSIRRHAKGGGWYLATDTLERGRDLPLVQWLADRELKRMPPELAAHARLASLLGGAFSVDELDGVLRAMSDPALAAQFPLDARVGLERLAAAGLLVEREPDRFAFRHELIRDAVNREIPPTRRYPLHEAALRFYESTTGTATGDRLARIAFHAARCGRAARAAEAYLALAELARRRHAYLDAENAFSHAIAELAPDGAATALALRGRGLMRYRLGQHDGALADFAQARAVAVAAEAPAIEVEILLDEAEALDWIDEYRRSHELVERAAELARTVGVAAPVDARLSMARGRSAFRLNHNEIAADLLRAAAAASAPLGDDGYETYVISLLLGGYVLATLGRLDESERAFDTVIPLCERRGDKLHLGAALGNRAMLWTCRNDKEKVVADLERLLEISREVGNARMEQQASFYLGLYQHWIGNHEKAVQSAARAVAIDEARLGEAARPESALLHARTLLVAGDDAGARAVLERIAARQETQRSRGDIEWEFLPAERVFFSMVELASSGGSDDAWSALSAEAEQHLAGQDLIEFLEVRGVIAFRQASYGLAVAAFEAAVAIARSTPNVMLDRLERRLRQARGCAE